jgi:hypothetical protein
MKKKIVKLINSEAAANTAAEEKQTARTEAKRDPALKPIGSEAALDVPQVQTDDATKVVRTESASPEGIQIATFSPESGTYFEGETSEQTAAVGNILATVPETPALVTEPTPATEPATLTVETPVPVKTKRTKKEKKKPVKVAVVDTATLFAIFKAAKLENPFKETVRDFKRFASASGAEKFEDALPGFKDEKDLKGFIAWVLRGTPGYKK